MSSTRTRRKSRPKTRPLAARQFAEARPGETNPQPVSEQDLIRCPHCGHMNVLPAAKRTPGKTVSCPRCARMFSVEHAETAPLPEPPAPAGPPPDLIPHVPAREFLGPREGPNYRPPPPKRRNMKKVWLTVFGFLLGGGALWAGGLASVLVPSLNKASEQAERARCANNLTAVGLSVLTYAKSHHGAFPDAIPAAPTGGAGSSYHYVGKALTVGSAPEAAEKTVLAYEPLTSHARAGIHVLFADGHVAFVAPPFAQKLVADVESGTNPPAVSGY